ncbi:hypothetical protein [Bryobacter aggregatus]|uniref:hypothetical protein n=1 Tax=Bryobacter aggregatus TaxID=360054 RepID=UPI0004E0BA0A|nr:hypothetical protein [Bryobacter aggregatus]
MLKTDAMPQLDEFAAEAPASRIGVIRRLWPSIRSCLDAGHSIRAVQARLKADGVSIPYSTLCWAISILRVSREAGERSSDRKGGDPLANLHRVGQRRPGFEYTGTMSDEDLFGKK